MAEEQTVSSNGQITTGDAPQQPAQQPAQQPPAQAPQQAPAEAPQQAPAAGPDGYSHLPEKRANLARQMDQRGVPLDSRPPDLVPRTADDTTSVTDSVDRAAQEWAKDQGLAGEDDGEVIGDDALSSVTVEQGVAVVRVAGGDFERQTGAVQQVLEPLETERIYLHDVVTSASSVSVFVDWEDRERALELVRGVF